QAAGLIAKRALAAGKPIRQADLMKPELVARNETVTIVFEVPGIMLTTRGKALEAGAQGDLVNVLNVQSKRTVQATVSGPGRVTPPLTAINNPTAQPGYKPVQMPMPAPQPAVYQPNSLWRTGSRAFFKDQRANQIGDILTVKVKITDKASLENETARSRKAAE